MINYSIIIPTKNNQLVLQRCLDSIPRREDIQIIVVDDNSNPKIIDFKNYPGLNDGFVKIIFTKEGKGAGYARNIGLKHAIGKWILFADSDDFYNDCFLSSVDRHKGSESDIIYFRVNSVFSDTLKISDRGDVHSQQVERFTKDKKNNENNLRYFYSTPWAKMIKKDLISKNNLKFDEVIAANDIMFSIKSGHFADQIDVDMNYLYCATVSKGSLTNIKSYNVIFSRYLVTLRVNQFLIKNQKSKYRRSVIFFILVLFTFGIKSITKTISAAIKYNANIFIGMENWPKTLFTYRKKNKNKKEYIVKK